VLGANIRGLLTDGCIRKYCAYLRGKLPSPPQKNQLLFGKVCPTMGTDITATQGPIKTRPTANLRIDENLIFSFKQTLEHRGQIWGSTAELRQIIHLKTLSISSIIVFSRVCKNPTHCKNYENSMRRHLTRYQTCQLLGGF
jgi:hypothetical protein